MSTRGTKRRRGASSSVGGRGKKLRSDQTIQQAMNVASNEGTEEASHFGESMRDVNEDAIEHDVLPDAENDFNIIMQEEVALPIGDNSARGPDQMPLNSDKTMDSDVHAENAQSGSFTLEEDRSPQLLNTNDGIPDFEFDLKESLFEVLRLTSRNVISYLSRCSDSQLKSIGEDNVGPARTHLDKRLDILLRLRTACGLSEDIIFPYGDGAESGASTQELTTRAECDPAMLISYLLKQDFSLVASNSNISASDNITLLPRSLRQMTLTYMRIYGLHSEQCFDVQSIMQELNFTSDYGDLGSTEIERWMSAIEEKIGKDMRELKNRLQQMPTDVTQPLDNLKETMDWGLFTSCLGLCVRHYLAFLNEHSSEDRSESDYDDRAASQSSKILAAEEEDEADFAKRAWLAAQAAMMGNVEGEPGLDRTMNSSNQLQPPSNNSDLNERGGDSMKRSSHNLGRTSMQIQYEAARKAVAERVAAKKILQHTEKSSRRPWSDEEEQALMEGLDKVQGPYWSQILTIFGAGGTVSEVLKDRSQIQLKDKARNLKLYFLKNGRPVPEYLQTVTGDLRSRAPARAAKNATKERLQASGLEDKATHDAISALTGPPPLKMKHTFASDGHRNHGPQSSEAAKPETVDPNRFSVDAEDEAARMRQAIELALGDTDHVPPRHDDRTPTARMVAGS